MFPLALSAMVTCFILHQKLSVQGDSRKSGFQEKLIINQTCKYQWKLDTTAHMVKHWTNQLIVSAQMEQVGLLPRTTGIHLRLNEANCWVAGHACKVAQCCVLHFCVSFSSVFHPLIKIKIEQKSTGILAAC